MNPFQSEVVILPIAKYLKGIIFRQFLFNRLLRSFLHLVSVIDANLLIFDSLKSDNWINLKQLLKHSELIIDSEIVDKFLLLIAFVVKFDESDGFTHLQYTPRLILYDFGQFQRLNLDVFVQEHLGVLTLLRGL